MKLKLIVVDFEVPLAAKKWGLRLGIPVAMLLGSGAVAYGSGLVSWSSGQTLTAADLNNNFAYVQSQIAGVQGQVPLITAWQSYTPTVLAGATDISSSASTSAWWRRVGDTAEVKIVSVFSSCPGTGQVQWSFPSGVTQDASKSASYEADGDGLSVSGATVTTLSVTLGPAAPVAAVELSGAPTGGLTCSQVSAGQTVRLSFHLPVQGWTVTGP
ncbi:MAG TPA: hypothetical protein VF765_29935 [Polyangiaceae bacterium]